jgi:hypothetical protein
MVKRECPRALRIGRPAGFVHGSPRARDDDPNVAVVIRTTTLFDRNVDPPSPG